MKHHIKKIVVLLALTLFAVGAIAKSTAALSGTLASDEVHYYSAELAAGEYYLALEGLDLDEKEGFGDLDIYILDEEENILAMDVETDNMPYVEFSLEEPTEIWIVIHNAGTGATYYESVEYGPAGR
jgi:hypothetical protein